MKKFVFKLEPVRRIRQQEEQLVQVELAAALRDRAAAAERLQASRAAEVELYEYLRDPNVQVRDMLHVSRYGELHRRKIVEATVELAHKDEAIERIRARLTTARARREALDKLCERQREQHRRDQLAEEARELDEIGSLRRGLFGMAEPEVYA